MDNSTRGAGGYVGNSGKHVQLKSEASRIAAAASAPPSKELSAKAKAQATIVMEHLRERLQTKYSDLRAVRRRRFDARAQSTQRAHRNHIATTL